MFDQLYLCRTIYDDVRLIQSDIEAKKYRLYRPELGSFVFYFFQLLAFVRLLLLSANVEQIEGDNDAYFDSYMAFVARANRLYDSFFYVTMAPLYLSGAAQHFVVYYSMDGTIWSNLHCLIVQNWDQFLRANPALVFKIPRQQFLVNCYRQIGLMLGTIVSGRFKQTRPLEHYPHLSAQDQFRLLLLSGGHQLQVWAFQFVLFTSFIWAIVLRRNLYTDPLVPTQATLYMICGLIGAKSVSFLALCVLVFSHSAMAEYRKLRARISWAILHSKLGHQTIGLNIVRARHALYRQLSAYRRDHTRITKQLMHVNERLTSPCLFIYFVCTILFNAYANVFIHFGNPTPKLYRSLVVILIFQSLVPILVLLLMTRVNRHIKSSASCLAFALARLAHQNGHQLSNGQFIWEHWKVATYYELLHRRHKEVQLTAGPLGAVQSESILNLVLIYSSYVMYFCGKFMMKS